MNPKRIRLGELYLNLNRSGLSYSQIAVLHNTTRGSVSGAIRDYKKLSGGSKNISTGRPSAPSVRLRGVVFDIETMPNNFTAESELDILVCVSFYPLDQDSPHTIALTHKEMLSLDNIDLPVLLRTMNELEKYDILIGHNIAAYDLNWLLTRLVYYGLPFPKKRHLYYDTYSAAKRIALKTRKDLGTLGLFIQSEGEKTKIQRPGWTKLWTKNKKQFRKALKDIIYHCEQDVITNRKLFDELWTRDLKATNLPFYRKWA